MFGLWEIVNSFIVIWIILLFLSCYMLDTFGPGIKRSTPVATWFNGNIIYSSNNSEKSVFSPMRSPWISDIPKLNSIFFTPADNSYLMHCVKITCSVVINSSNIVIKRLWDCDWASERTSLVQLIHHSFFTMNMTILINTVNIVFRRDIASLTWFAVAAESHRTATNSVIMASCLVNRTSFISDIVFMDPLVGVICITSMTSIIFLFTRNKYLRRNVYVWPGGFASNFNSIW